MLPVCNNSRLMSLSNLLTHFQFKRTFVLSHDKALTDLFPLFALQSAVRIITVKRLTWWFPGLPNSPAGLEILDRGVGTGIQPSSFISLRPILWEGGGGGLNYLRAHINLRFRHAHHETKDWLPSLGSRGGRDKRVLLKCWNCWEAWVND